MGMYDEVSVRCPRCSEINTIQTSAYKCTLTTYSLDKAPQIILEDIENEDIYCDACDLKFTIKLETVIKKVPHIAVED